MEEKLRIIREFAKAMDYEINEYDYIHCRNKRKCHSIELIGTHDSEGDAFSWAWYLDTGEQI